METDKIFSLEIWWDLTTEIDGFKDDKNAHDQFMYRFLGQYLPAIMSATTQEGYQKAINAMWQYKTAPSTVRNPFNLDSRSADMLIAKVQNNIQKLIGSENNYE